MVTNSEVLGSRPGSSKHQDAPPTPVVPPIPSTPTSFRMASESMLDMEKKEKEEGLMTASEPEPCADSTYGVKSLGESMVNTPPDAASDNHEEEEEDGDDSHERRRRSTLKPNQATRESSSEGIETSTRIPTTNFSPTHPDGLSRPQSMAHSLTSLSLDSQAPLSSPPSSPKSYSNRSFRPSDDESMDEGSQAVVSSSEDDAQPSTDLRESAPQLIMPSIKMPSRRPFTERGRDMGRLKILLAGDSGVGKTSLIKSIVQTCEDIVHVDPISSHPPSIEQLPLQKSKKKQDITQSKSTQHITEVYASTRPYPDWWSEVEETKVLRRRKSVGDTVLERNLCFVDTPGYGNGLSKMEGIESVLQYVESQLRRSFSPPSEGESDIVGLLSGSGGSQVDVVFYLISQGKPVHSPWPIVVADNGLDIKHEDLVFLQRLAALTNVVPLVAKSDTLSPEELEMQRRSIAEHLHQAKVKSFTPDIEGAKAAPYTICSAPSDDDDNMDASLLMSPDYVQPLVPSELSLVLQQIFEKETVSCLRHLAAKKLLHVHRHPTAAIIPNSNLSTPQLSPYLQARLADHTQQEEKLAQIKLAKWASDLQSSLRSERARYEAIAQGERTMWLTEKLGAYVGDQDGIAEGDSAVTLRNKRAASGKTSAIRYTANSRGMLDAGDPLGLLKWNEAMKRRGWVVFQVVGVSSVMGALAMWAARTWVGASDEEYWVWSWLGMR